MSKKPKANPITFKLNDEGAMMTFAFVAKEDAEEASKIVKAFLRHKKIPENINLKEEEHKEKAGIGSGVAMGLHLNPETRDYELVKINYDMQQKSATISEVSYAGKLAARAYDALKIAFIKNKVIR